VASAILFGMFYGLLLFGLVRVGVWQSYVLSSSRRSPLWRSRSSSLAQFPSPVVPPDAWQVGYDAVDGHGRFVPQSRVKELNDEFGRVGCRAAVTTATNRISERARRLSASAVSARRSLLAVQLYEAGVIWR